MKYDLSNLKSYQFWRHVALEIGGISKICPEENSHDLYEVPSSLLLLNNDFNTRGHQYKLLKLRTSTRVRQKVFTQRVVDMWNDLPNDIVSANDINHFKNSLDTYWKNRWYQIWKKDRQKAIQRLPWWYQMVPDMNFKLYPKGISASKNGSENMWGMGRSRSFSRMHLGALEGSQAVKASWRWI